MSGIGLDQIAEAFGFGERQSGDSHLFATVSGANADGSLQVRLDGASASTRAASLCRASAGDRVLCVVSDNRMTVVGRVGGEADFVIARGSQTVHGEQHDTYWEWVRWSSGLVEAWAETSEMELSISNEWGALFESPSLVEYYPQGMFAATPKVFPSWSGSLYAISGIEIGTGGTSEHTQHFYLLRPAAATAKGKLALYCVGRWK